jgi:Zn-dependent protease
MGFFRPGEPGSPIAGGRLNPVFLVAIVLAVTIHEFSHAFIATRFGDDLPRRLGRLTLNPLAHLDLMGSLLFLMVGFGWGKPVPINPASMRNPSLGWALSSIAGPVSNLLTAAVVVTLLAFARGAASDQGVQNFMEQLLRVSVLLAVFNLVPLPPLDGFGFLFGLSPKPLKIALLPLQTYGPWILLALLFLPSILPGFPPILNILISSGERLVYNLLTLLYAAASRASAF